MADRTNYFTGINNSTINELEADQPRARIAVACNRCRRRKIKCSGSTDGGPCEACIRANDAECVFADRPQQQGLHHLQQHKPGNTQSLLYSSSGMASSMHVQPRALPPRSSSLPSQPPPMHRVHSAVDRSIPIRTVSGNSRTSLSSSMSTSPSHHDGRSSPSFAMSPSSKRQSLTSVSHPYQRPGSAGYRKNSGDSINVNLARYSQSLVQLQSQQLSSRGQSRTLSVPAPTSIPVGYTYPASAYQLQPPAVHFPPQFKQPDYDHSSTAVFMDSGGPPEMNMNAPSRTSLTPDQMYCSPTYDSSIYSVSTPDLLSSESVSTLDSRSSASFSMDQSMYRPMPYNTLTYGQLAFVQQAQQPCNNYGVTSASCDPSQWTPGLEKLDKQYMEFNNNLSASATFDYDNVT